MDGPNIEKLFTETDCLTAQSNLKDIVQYLRFFKDGDAYQLYLVKYLPKLASPEYKETFDEFIDDLDDKDRAEELKNLVKPAKVETAVVEIVAEPTETVTDTVEVTLPKKRGRKAKIIS